MAQGKKAKANSKRVCPPPPPVPPHGRFQAPSYLSPLVTQVDAHLLCTHARVPLFLPARGRPCALQYVLLLLTAYPLAAVFSRLPNATAKHVFSAVVGVWTMQFVFYGQWIHSFISSAVTYLMVLVLPNKWVEASWFVSCV